jgi:hypothetical protein
LIFPRLGRRPQEDRCGHRGGPAANQGLYNGFLAAGLVYGLITDGFAFQVFFLCCVIVAGLYGTVTASRRILFVQAVPAALALILVPWAHRGSPIRQSACTQSATWQIEL